MTDFSKAWRELWKAPDGAMLVAGGVGERQVAWVRVLVVTLLLFSPVYRQIVEPFDLKNVLGLVDNLLALAYALAVYFYLRYRSYTPWVGFLTSAMDGALVSLLLVLYVIMVSPLDGMNDTYNFEVYFLVIMAVSLRQDRRICLLAGSLVVLQYGVLLSYVMTHYDLVAVYRQHPSTGEFNTVYQIRRLVLLSSAVLISFLYTSRARALVNDAIHDPLTGLLNRGYFDTLFEHEIERAHRYNHSFAVVMLDADHFKRINDTQGHTVGDAVLKALGQMLRNSVRDSDIVVRFGGEEFVLLLDETDAKTAHAKAEVLRLAVQKAAVILPNHASVDLTISIGIAVYPDDGENAHVLLSCADKRMLRAKQAGRNRVVADDRVG
jgi:diguanylate cyclase (GGDEF)-like protein